MSIKSFAAKIFAGYIRKKIDSWSSRPVEVQAHVFKDLIQKAAETEFGKDHGFSVIKDHKDFVAKVPVRDYEELRYYVDKMVAGEPNILWPGKPLYYAKTSGITSGAKYIPLTKESMPTHIEYALNSSFCIIAV